MGLGLPDVVVLLPHHYDVELVCLSWSVPRMHPTHWVPGSWEVPLIWPVRWEKLETSSKTDGCIRDCHILYLGWHCPTTWSGIKYGEVSDLQLTSGQVNQLRVGMRLFVSPIEVSDLWVESFNWGMMSLWLTHLCSEIKRSAKQVMAGWRTMFDCTDGWSSP